jgi:hypothetical protein
MKDFILTKLQEQGTWTGLAAILASLVFIPHAADIAQLIPAVGVVVAGIAKIVLNG